TYRAWAFSIARNVVIDRARLRKLKITSIDPETLTDQSKLIDDDGSLWKLARRTLSPDQLQALWLRHVEDLSPREIALAMDCSWVKVRTLLSRAHRQLRAALSEIEIENKP
ncbi:MAG TPA: RNA polymerase sigma factor, partial [Tepidisphaeraceae bacterium]|nr:RNA polymerase sigma factor [Tepidisphaeraceae bacterium]